MIENRDLWQSSHFICADGDNLAGIEFFDSGENAGQDKNPDGLEPWTEPGLLSQKLPGLLEKAYAVGESISSMLKEPLHRRFRIIFLFDHPFTDENHYKHVFALLADEFPIISKVERAPSQPVFGNGREGFNFHICGNILKLKDYPLAVRKPKERIHQESLDISETLENFLQRHHIAYAHSKDTGKFYVDCPYKAGHTDGKQGKTDSYVFDDGTGWAFYCSHAHCVNNRTWNAFKAGHNISNGNDFQKRSANYVSDPPPPPPGPEDIEQSDEDTQMVQFPEDLFYGVFETYRNSLEGRTPVPDAFAFATMKHIISASLGRRIHLTSQIPIYPNIYTGLIGESSTAHKGVSLTLANQVLQKADPNVMVLTKTSTEEGLIDLFRTPDLKTGTNDEGEYEYYVNGVADLLPHDRVDEMVANIDSHESVRIMGCFEELSSILNRSKKVTFSGGDRAAHRTL